MKRILLIGNHDIVIYNFRKELIERLLEEKFEVYIALPYGNKVDLLVEMGCHFINLPIDRRGTNPIKDFSLLMKYIKTLKKIKPDIVLTYTIKPNIYGGIACRIMKTPYISNITGLGSAVESNRILQRITVFLYKIAFKKVRCVFFQNTENQQFFVDRNIACLAHRLIPGSGVNLEHFQYLEYPSDDTIEFLFIARVMKEKGIDQYLETAEYITSKYPNTKFHVLGFCEEAYEATLKELSDKNIIHYHGLQSDVRVFLQRSHCTIHPSYYPEGMSNVLLESEACGRPVITTNRSGCKETVDNERTGYIFEARNVGDLIDKVEKFILLSNDEKKQMGINARKKVEKEFDRKIVIDAYIDEMNKIHNFKQGV